MFKIALLIWVVLGATLAGVALTLVLTVPALQPNAMKLLPIFAAVGFVVAIPAPSRLLGRRSRSVDQAALRAVSSRRRCSISSDRRSA